MPSGRSILLAILYVALSRIAVEFFMTAWRTGNILHKQYRGHNTMRGLCASSNDISDDIDLYCRIAKDALDKGLPLAFTEAVLRETKWCMGYDCSFQHSGYSWYMAAAALLFNIPVLFRIYRWNQERPIRQRNHFMKESLKSKRS